MSDLNAEGNYNLLPVKDEAYMRGTDLRSPLRGICLIIDKPFSNGRNAGQGLARVGRFQDPCERLLTSRTDMVSRELEVQSTARLIAFKTTKMTTIIQSQSKNTRSFNQNRGSRQLSKKTAGGNG